VVGAFRFICGYGQLLYDDPIVKPGAPGTSHLHQFYGNTNANANSTYESLRASGSSTCNYGRYAANRSAYWIPAMLDGKGNVVQPDYSIVYYKRRPLSDPKCGGLGSVANAIGTCVIIPNGLRFVFGWDPTGNKQHSHGFGLFQLPGADRRSGHYSTITAAARIVPPARAISSASSSGPDLLGRDASRRSRPPQPRHLHGPAQRDRATDVLGRSSLCDSRASPWARGIRSRPATT
jgi:hypothetical protein